MIETRIEVWYAAGHVDGGAWHWRVWADGGEGEYLEAQGSARTEEVARRAARFAAEYAEEVAYEILRAEDVR